MIAGLLALLAGAAPPDPAAPTWLLTAAARSHPAGGILGVEALVDQGGGLSLGGYLNYAYYWVELGPKLEWKYLDGFLIGAVQLGLEPGYFFPASRDVREPGLRALARGRFELNLKLDRFWLYDRVTVEGRLRSFAEHDPYRDAVLDSELSGEEAIAPIVKLYGWDARRAIWAYAELTVSAEASFGLLDLRPSGGIIAEEIFDGFTFDLDIYRSLRDGPVNGWGALLFVWWRP